jgi:PTS system glucose-specific IIA component
MFKNLFGKKESVVQIMAPLNGKIVDITHVPDPVFSQKMMGDGVAIEPVDGLVVSPIEGEVVSIFPTKHAIGLKTKSGLELLIHIGLETVNLNGEGFETFVTVGDKIKPGDKLISFNLDIIREKAASTITPIIITNTDEWVKQIDKKLDIDVKASVTEILTVTPK